MTGGGEENQARLKARWVVAVLGTGHRLYMRHVSCSACYTLGCWGVSTRGGVVWMCPHCGVFKWEPWV